MWILDSEYNKWYRQVDTLTVKNFDFLKQSLESVRFYSKCLSGATYYPVNDLDNIYDVLTNHVPRNWYLSSPYGTSTTPATNPFVIVESTSDEFYNKYAREYALTLKNLFTPKRLINDSLSNFIYVDVASTIEIVDLTEKKIGLVIDGVVIKEGHRILVKDQRTYVTLSNSIDPDSYFYPKNYHVDELSFRTQSGVDTDYYYYNEYNGIYIYSKNKLVKESDLDIYNDCIRYSICVKLGQLNKNKQFHLVRMRDGYYPTTSDNSPIEFVEKHNWIIRNRVDYNNVLDLNFYDVLKHDSQTYYDRFRSFTYSIPERLIGIGEFGGIINYQNNIEHIINNKYKVNLRSIAQVNGYYWICGDEGTILKVSKVDFSIEKKSINILSTLKSISFFNDLRGIVVGDYNVIYTTVNGGHTWSQIFIDEFFSYNYNKVIYYSIDKFFVCGNNGVFLEFIMINDNWSINKKRVSKYIDTVEDEYILVDHINSMISFTTSNWGLSYSYSTSSIPAYKEGLLLVTNNNNFIVYNLNSFIKDDFIYLDFGSYNYGDIRSVSWRSTTNDFYFSGQEVYSFNINNFNTIGSSVSNVVYGITGSVLSQNVYANNIRDYKQNELLIVGNNSLFDYATYSYLIDEVLDSTFNVRLKSKLLFLDYDIASKLNFFDDQQNYRLPNQSPTFSSLSFSATSYLNLSPIDNDTNWLTYWSDRLKTFEYYSNSISINDSYKVEMSFTFSYTNTNTSILINPSNITVNYGDIVNLAPSIGSDAIFGPGITDSKPQASRYTMPVGGSLISSPLTSTYQLFIYDYLMIFRTLTTNPTEVGDVIRLESEPVSDNFIVNKKVIFGSYSYFYLYTDFNETISNDINVSTYSVTLTNLNKYSDAYQLYDRFNKHPISNAYTLLYSTASNTIEISTEFNNLTAYYNLATEINLSGVSYNMDYKDTFLKFGYKPHYNLLSYLENINSDLFNSSKELLVMPIYNDIKGPNFEYYPGYSGFTSSNIYIDISYSTNRLVFGEDLKFEWESLFIYTYVDVSLKTWENITTLTGYLVSDTNRLLIINKYYTDDYNGSGKKAYILEFHRKIKFKSGNDIEYISISSRRNLLQISDDLKELSNIQRPLSISTFNDNTVYSFTYSNYESELNFKFPTDSYAKILLSDDSIISNLSAIIYTDYKNELSMNITKLDREFEVPIIETNKFTIGTDDYLYISCNDKHGLSEGDGIILEFTGGTGSSQTLNTQYFGFHTVGLFPNDEYNFYVYTLFGTQSAIGNDPGLVKYVRRDPFFNYQPVDLIDLGVDGEAKISINLRPENLNLVGSRYELVDVDYKNYKFRLLDGLTLEIVTNLYPWILEAEISDAIIGMDTDMNLIWYTGIWHCGRWFGNSNGRLCTWISGTWISGDWYGGVWKSNSITDKLISIDVQKISEKRKSIWYSGRWYSGTWENGTWQDGRWYGGNWQDGDWFNGIWNDGVWSGGNFTGGVWVMGEWRDGIFNCDNSSAYWLDGSWNGGDFENGMWYNGVWDSKNGKKSRFGVKSFNSKTTTWHGGKWIGGEFHSRLNLDSDGNSDVSLSHKLSIWKTGIWSGGDWYGGVAYNIDFRYGNWYGGISEDIQIVGVSPASNTFQLNGIFKFNSGDSFRIIDNGYNGIFSIYGSNDNPIIYKILKQTEDTVNNITTIYVDKDLVGSYSVSQNNMNIKMVSYFNNSNWYSGIWMNGVFENGLFDGGIWYNGLFDGDWG